MGNEYILIINIENQTRKILEKNYIEKGYQIFKTPEESIILARKVVNKEAQNVDNYEEKVLKLVANIAQKFTTNGSVCIDISSEINKIIEESEENFKLGNRATWRIRQALKKAIVDKTKNIE